MKIRNGFVSNSSSSSFVVVFNKKPKSEDEVKKLLYPEADYEDTISLYDEYKVTIKDIVSTVFKDIKESHKLTLPELIEIFGSGYREYQIYAKQKDKDKLAELEYQEDEYSRVYYKKYHELRDKLGIKSCDKLPSKNKKNEKWLEEYKELEDNRSKYLHEFLEKKDKLKNKMAKDTASIIFKKYKDKYIAEFSYSDKDEVLGCVMEHEGIFDNLDHYTISHH